MAAQTGPAPTAPLSDIARTVARLTERGLARETEVTIATVALWLLDRVQSGSTAPDEATAVFLALDDVVSQSAIVDSIQDATGQLLVEGELFHDLGTAYGTDPDRLTQLALTVLGGTCA
ncbi:MAG: hypothetical protein IT307_12490 [Chloroflexi bacterium]|nr:hypothetical protein [Chloroflexota bacterium]